MDERRTGGIPEAPAGFWNRTDVQDAANAQKFGAIVALYRHARTPTIAQLTMATELGVGQSHLSRLESGKARTPLDRLPEWFDVLGMPESLRWVRSQHAPEASKPGASTRRLATQAGSAREQGGDVNRRELLRLASLAGSLLAIPDLPTSVDPERIQHAAHSPRYLDHVTLDQYAKLNGHLWRVFARSQSKREVLPQVRTQLNALTSGLQEPQSAEARRRLSELAGDLFQLSGEIMFDGDHYADAAHCYSLAIHASREAHHFDLWACAMTRSAFLSIYDHDYVHAQPILAGAAKVASRGDTSLSTRHWVAAVQGQTFAGLGDLDACELALSQAERVVELPELSHSGWLRFEGSRLDEERGSCYVALRRPDLAEPALQKALRRHISVRRRGSVLTLLATAGAQRGDLDQVIMHGNAALDAVRQTESAGYVGRKLADLHEQLVPYLRDRHVRNLDTQIRAVNHVWA